MEKNKGNWKKAKKSLIVATVIATQMTVLPLNVFATDSLQVKEVTGSKAKLSKRSLAVGNGEIEVKVTVTTFEELKNALEQGQANVIVLDADIQLSSNITISKDVRIEGGGYNLSLVNYQFLMKSNSIMDIENVQLNNAAVQPMIRAYDSAQSPTINILGDVQARGYLIGGSGNTTLTIAGEANSFISQANYAIQVSNLQIQDNAKIDNLTADRTAIDTLSNGTVVIGKNVQIDMTSNKGYAFDASLADVSIGDNSTIKSKALYGSIRAASLTVGNGANVNLASGIDGHGIYLTGNLKIGDQTSFISTGQGTGIYANASGASIDVGENSSINIQSKNTYGIYSLGKISFGDGTAVEINSHLQSLRAGTSGVQFGSISNQQKAERDKVTIKLNSDLEYGIWSSGPVIFGDSTEGSISSRLSSIYANGVSNVNIGSYSNLVLKSNIQYGIVSGGVNVGDNTNLDIDSYARGMVLTQASGLGLRTKDNVKLKVKTSGEDGIYSINDVNFGTNNTIDILSLSNNGIYTYTGSAVNLDSNSSLNINAKNGIRQSGAGSLFTANQAAKVKINSTQEAIYTDGGVKFLTDSIANIKAASGLGEDAAIRANHGVTFNQNTSVYVETLSDRSRTVFDISGYQNSKLTFNGSKFIDIRQGNRSVTGHIVQGYSNNSQNSIVTFNNVPKLFAWNHATSWSKPQDGEWSELSSVVIPLTSTAGSKNVNYYSGVPEGENISGFELFDYSRVSTSAQSNITSPVIDTIHTNDKFITGTGVAGNQVVVTFPDTTTGSATVNEEGKWSLNIPQAVVLIEGDVVKAYQTNGLLESVKTQTVVQADLRIPDAPLINKVIAGDTVVTGEAEPGNTVNVLLPDGTTVTTTATSDGAYTATIPAQKEGDTIRVTQSGENGKESNPTSVIVDRKLDYSITPNGYNIDSSSYLTGNVGVDVAKVRIYVNGKVVNNVTPTSGKFKAYVRSYVTHADDEVKVVSLDSLGNEKEEKLVELSYNNVILTANVYTIGESQITGTIDSRATTAVLFDTDTNTAIRQVKVNNDGTYKISASDVITSVSNKYAIVAKEGSTELKRVPLVVNEAPTKDYTLTADDYVIGDTYISGTYDEEGTKVVLYVDGVAVKNSALDTGNKTYKVIAKGLVTNPNQKVEMVMSKGTQELKRVDVSIATASESQYVLTANDYTIGDATLTGTYDAEATKVVLYVDGVAVKNSALDSDTKTYKVVAKSFVKNKSQKVEVVMSKGTTELKRVTVKISDGAIPEYSLTANDYQVGDVLITGTYDAEATKVVLYVDGVAVKNSALDKNNLTYAVTAKGLVTNSSKTVEMVMSKGTQELKRITVNVSKLYNLSAETYKLGDNYIIGSYDAEATKVVMYVDGIAVKNGAINDEDLTYTIAAKGFVSSVDQHVEVVESKGTVVLKRVTVQVVE